MINTSETPTVGDFARVAMDLFPGREVIIQNFQREVAIRILRGDHTLLDARPGVPPLY